MKKIILYFMFVFVILISNNSICSHEDINRGNLDAIDSIPIVAINKNGEIYDINLREKVNKKNIWVRIGKGYTYEDLINQFSEEKLHDYLSDIADYRYIDSDGNLKKQDKNLRFNVIDNNAYEKKQLGDVVFIIKSIDIPYEDILNFEFSKVDNNFEYESQFTLDGKLEKLPVGKYKIKKVYSKSGIDLKKYKIILSKIEFEVKNNSTDIIELEILDPTGKGKKEREERFKKLKITDPQKTNTRDNINIFENEAKKNREEKQQKKDPQKQQKQLQLETQNNKSHKKLYLSVLFVILIVVISLFIILRTKRNGKD